MIASLKFPRSILCLYCREGTDVEVGFLSKFAVLAIGEKAFAVCLRNCFRFVFDGPTISRSTAKDKTRVTY